MSESFSGYLRNQGFAYQYVARFQPLAFLLTEVWLKPTVSYCNRVTFTEVATRAMEARQKMVCAGLTENWEVERDEHTGAPRAFDAVLDNVAFVVAFGIATNSPGREAGMLQIRLAGTVPRSGECHFAFPSDCFSRSAKDR